MTESWKSVAFALAVRLEHMAGLGDSCDEHTTFVETCGYCADARAYARFEAKCAASGIRLSERFGDATMVDIKDIPVTRTSLPAPPPPLPADATVSVKTMLGSEDPVGPTRKAKPKRVTVIGLPSGPWHMLQDAPVDDLFWCGGRRQFRHVPYPGPDRGWDTVTCERCRAARRQGQPKAWGR